MGRFMSASACLNRGTLPASCPMPSIADKSLGDDPPSYATANPLQPDPFSGMPLHVYPISNTYLQPQQPLRTKRRQVKNACTHCQKACKKCDDARPCLRCVKYGVSEECVNSQRKERKKGIKRGPYKKRDGKGRTIDRSDAPLQDVAVQNGAPGIQAIPYMTIPGYPAGYYSQYPTLVPKQGDGHAAYLPPQYILASGLHHMQQVHGAPDRVNAYAPQTYYQTTVLPISYHPSYAIARADGSTPQYPHYPVPIYHKEVSTPGQGEIANGIHVGAGGQDVNDKGA